MTAAAEYTLAELCIVAASKSFADEGEVLGTGIGVVPRLAASLAMKTTNPDLMMTDSEAWMLSEPNPIGGLRAFHRELDGLFAHLRQRVEPQAARHARPDPD